MRDYGVLPSTKQERQLEPRYRRILTFGDLLDESIGLFRRHWVTFAVVSAVWLIPPGLLAVLFSASRLSCFPSEEKQAQRRFFICLFGRRPKACAQASQAVSVLTPEKNR